jgi:ethanolamine utilization protein EutA
MNFGGRILELDNQNGSIQYIADPARMILDDIGLVFNIGYIPSMAELRRFTTRIADMAAELFEGKISPLSKLLYLTPPVNQNGIGSVISFSGGVGYYIHNPVSILNIMDVSIHGDIGPLLAESILENPVFRSQAIIPPAETLRATVLGACTQTVSLSGSTIWIDKSRLPLRNIPVVKIALEQREGFENLQSKDLMNAIIKMDINPETDLCALAFDFSNSLDYDQLTNLGKTLVEYSENSLPNDHPLIVLIERDYAQVLGQTIQGLVNHRPLIVIDQVGLEGGDYIDIGMPLLEERVVPISIKTLVFYH